MPAIAPKRATAALRLGAGIRPEHGEQRHGAASPYGRPGEVQQIGDRSDRQRLVGVEGVPGQRGADEDDRRRERRDGAQPPVERHQGGGGRRRSRRATAATVTARSKRVPAAPVVWARASAPQNASRKKVKSRPASRRTRSRFEPERPEDETREAGAARRAEHAEQEQRAHDDPLPRDGAARPSGRRPEGRCPRRPRTRPGPPPRARRPTRRSSARCSRLARGRGGAGSRAGDPSRPAAGRPRRCDPGRRPRRSREVGRIDPSKVTVTAAGARASLAPSAGELPSGTAWAAACCAAASATAATRASRRITAVRGYRFRRRC